MMQEVLSRRESLEKLRRLGLLGGGLVLFGYSPQPRTIHDDLRELKAKRDSLISLKIGDFEFKYFGSNLHQKDNYLFAGRIKGAQAQDVFKVDGEKILGPVAHIKAGFNKDFVSLDISSGGEFKFTPLPSLNNTYVYAGIYSVFSLEADGNITKIQFIKEEGEILTTPNVFNPLKLDLSNAWELVRRPYGSLAQKDKKPAEYYVHITQDQNPGPKAWLHESYPFNLYPYE